LGFLATNFIWSLITICFTYRLSSYNFFSLCETQIAGAAAATGLSLDEVAAEAKRASEMVGTMGVALSVCTLPGQVTSDRLGPGKMELGLGIVSHFHGVIAFLMSKVHWTSFWFDNTWVHLLLYVHIYHNAIMFTIHERDREGERGGGVAVHFFL
jgi:hypothetical protein